MLLFLPFTGQVLDKFGSVTGSQIDWKSQNVEDWEKSDSRFSLQASSVPTGLG